MDDFGIFMGAILIFWAIMIAVLVAIYVVTAMGVSRLAKSSGFENKAFMAWIPFANSYLIGLMIGEMDLFGKRITRMEIWMLVAIAAPMLGIIPLLGQLISLACLVFSVMAHIELMGRYEPDKKVLYGLFSPIGYWFVGKRASEGMYSERTNTGRNKENNYNNSSEEDELDF